MYFSDDDDDDTHMALDTRWVLYELYVNEL